MDECKIVIIGFGAVGKGVAKVISLKLLPSGLETDKVMVSPAAWLWISAFSSDMEETSLPSTAVMIS